MTDERNDSKTVTRGYSSFREAREAEGEVLHGAANVDDIREDDSMNPQPAYTLGSGFGAGVGAVAGATVGILGGPAGIVVGAATGAAIGGALTARPSIDEAN